MKMEWSYSEQWLYEERICVMKNIKKNWLMGVLMLYVINVISWILFIIFNLQGNESGLLADFLYNIMLGYMMFLHGIILGVIYVLNEKKIREYFNVSKVKCLITIFVVWIVSIFFNYSIVALLEENQTLPSVGEYMSGIEYILFASSFGFDFIVTICIGLSFKKSEKDNCKNNSRDGNVETDVERESGVKEEKKDIKNMLIYIIKVIFRTFAFSLLLWIPYMVIGCNIFYEDDGTFYGLIILPIIVGGIYKTKEKGAFSCVVKSVLWIVENYLLGIFMLEWFHTGSDKQRY